MPLVTYLSRTNWPVLLTFAEHLYSSRASPLIGVEWHEYYGDFFLTLWLTLEFNRLLFNNCGISLLHLNCNIIAVPNRKWLIG